MFSVADAAFALAFLANTAGMAFLFGRVFERQASHSRRLTNLEEAERAEGKGTAALDVSVAELKTSMTHFGDDLTYIKSQLATLAARSHSAKGALS